MAVIRTDARRRAACAIVALLLGSHWARGAAADDPSAGDGGVSAFYRWPGTLPPRPGILLRQEPLPAAHMIAHAAFGARILYTASAGAGPQRTIPVSGEVFLPAGTPPKGGWPVLAWAHGTTGIADVCAPSWRGQTKRDSAYLAAWLAHGFAIVATDYAGLGTQGVHPYLLWRSEGLAILDALRAARATAGFHLANRIVLAGQSQGAGAALGAAWLHPRYAPALGVRAAVLTGLVATIASGRPDEKGTAYTDPFDMDPSFAMLRFAGTDRASHPDMDPQTYLTPQGKMLLHVAQTACLHDMFAASAKAGITKGGALFSRSIAAVDSDMESHFDLPDGHITMPVFVGTGLADGEAGTQGQYLAVASMCAAGSKVAWHTYPGLTHNGTVNQSLADSLPFAARALAGEPIASNCASLVPPGKVEAAKRGVEFND